MILLPYSVMIFMTISITQRIMKITVHLHCFLLLPTVSQAALYLSAPWRTVMHLSYLSVAQSLWFILGLLNISSIAAGLRFRMLSGMFNQMSDSVSVIRVRRLLIDGSSPLLLGCNLTGKINIVHIDGNFTQILLISG